MPEIPGKSLLNGKIVLVCVGNILKGDDGFGPSLARMLDGRTSVKVIDAGVAPENHLGAVIRENPDTVVFADTADFGGRPGEAKILGFEEFEDDSFFLTHNASLELLREFIASSGVRARFLILCVQGRKMSLGEGLSAEVAELAGIVSSWLAENFPPDES